MAAEPDLNAVLAYARRAGLGEPIPADGALRPRVLARVEEPSVTSTRCARKKGAASSGSCGSAWPSVQKAGDGVEKQRRAVRRPMSKS